jgi:hypothetical protein
MEFLEKCSLPPAPDRGSTLVIRERWSNGEGPRRFLHGYVWCDQMIRGELDRSCRDERPKGGRRSNFPSKVKKAARWPGCISMNIRPRPEVGYQPWRPRPPRPSDQGRGGRPFGRRIAPERPDRPFVKPHALPTGGLNRSDPDTLPLARASRRVTATAANRGDPHHHKPNRGAWPRHSTRPDAPRPRWATGGQRPMGRLTRW